MSSNPLHPESFGEWVRRRRKLLDMTQEALATRASLSASAIRKIESDGRRPSRESAELLADALEITSDERALFLRMARASGDPSEMTAALPASTPETVHSIPAIVLVPGDPPTELPDPTDARASLATTEVVVDAISHRPLPTSPLPIVGRGQEIAQIAALLRDPQCRLLTIVGAGGMGKTRLALEVTRREEQNFSDGAVFVELTPLASDEYLPAAVAAALGLSSATRNDSGAATLEYLARRELLLVLDNMEHLLGAAGFISELIAGTPHVKVLVTSREHLNLSGEWVFEIQGLPVRGANAGSAALEDSAAATLFVQRASQADVSFQASVKQREAINRICALLGGMPLAIELAASWVRVLSPQEILEEISRSIDFLAANRRDLPMRHRSMRAVFEQSWALLGEVEQRTLRRVSLFRGSFSRDAVRAVADGSLGEISTLVAKSLLNHGGTDASGGSSISGRYRVHEMVRQFAREQLEQVGEVEETHARLLAYYLQFAERSYAEAISDRYVRWIEMLNIELDNLRLALEWGFVHDPLTALQLFCALRMLWEQRSSDEASEWMSRAIALAERTPGTPDDIHARVLGMAAWVDRDHRQAAERARGAIEHARIAGNQRLVATVLPLLGHAAIREGRPDDAQPFFDEALAIAISLDNPALEASVRNEVGKADRFLGFYERSREHHERARALAKQAGHPALQADASLNLNLISMRTGDYRQAQIWIEENLAISRAIGDRPATGWALQSLVRCYIFLGQFDQARTLLEQLRTFIEETPYRNQPENYHLLAGDFFLLQGDLEQGERSYRKSLATAQDPLYRGWCYRGLGSIARFRGEWEAAIGHLQDAIAISEATNERWNRGLCYVMLADIAHETYDRENEIHHLATAGAYLQPLGDKWGMARWCESASRFALSESNPRLAAVLLGAANMLRDAGGSMRADVEQDRNRYARTTLQAQLGNDAYHAALAEGGELAQQTEKLLSLIP